MDFLIAYDICHPRRLRRVARLLEKHGVRTQYSVFLFKGERAALERLLDEAARLLKAGQDVIQAWPVGGDPTAPELVRGTARPVYPAAVVLSSRNPVVVPRLPENPPLPKESSRCGTVRRPCHTPVVARSPDRATPPLWHGLLTVPHLPTAGLPGIPGGRDVPETFGHIRWHGQETVPQRGDRATTGECPKHRHVSNVPPQASGDVRQLSA